MTCRTTRLPFHLIPNVKTYRSGAYATPGIALVKVSTANTGLGNPIKTTNDCQQALLCFNIKLSVMGIEPATLKITNQTS
jgi:hypothetical protein